MADLSDLHLAYRHWMMGSEPVKVLELRHKEAHERVPTQMDILLFQSGQMGVSEHQRFTYLATAGMSTYAMDGPHKYVELILRIDGSWPMEDLEKLGKRLGELAVLPFREESCLVPNSLIRDESFPLFDHMNALLVTNWGIYSSEYLPGLDPTVLLLSLKPIYETEADAIEKIGVIEACRRFSEENISWYDPNRPVVHLYSLPNGRELVQEDNGQMLSALEIEESVRNAWKDIEKWYGENTPNLLQSLQPGASEQQLNDFETRVGFSLSKDYWASLKIHNGNVYVHDYCYLSLEGVLVNWEIMTNLVKRGDFDDRSSLGQGVIQNVWWHSKLIPFAEDSAGNQLCIDMSPGPDGVLGQIVYYETEEGLLVSPYTSFLEWLTNYRDELYQGMYKVEDGFLYKK